MGFEGAGADCTVGIGFPCGLLPVGPVCGLEYISPIRFQIFSYLVKHFKVNMIYKPPEPVELEFGCIPHEFQLLLPVGPVGPPAEL